MSNYLKKSTGLLCSVALVLAAPLAYGQGSAARPPLLQQLDGSWTMSGDVRGKPVTYALEVKPSLLGAFTELRMQDVQVPPKYAANVYIGYDDATKGIVVHWMDSFGARYSIPHGTGELKGDALEFTFPYEGGKFRDTFTFDPATATWTFVLESQRADGSWAHFARYKVVRKPTPTPVPPSADRAQ
jgi:hypothetical protein